MVDFPRTKSQTSSLSQLAIVIDFGRDPLSDAQGATLADTKWTRTQKTAMINFMIPNEFLIYSQNIQTTQESSIGLVSQLAYQKCADINCGTD